METINVILTEQLDEFKSLDSKDYLKSAQRILNREKYHFFNFEHYLLHLSCENDPNHEGRSSTAIYTKSVKIGGTLDYTESDTKNNLKNMINIYANNYFLPYLLITSKELFKKNIEKNLEELKTKPIFIGHH